MGFRSKFKGRIKKALNNVKNLTAVVSEEANHPGRPQPHMAARNPMWGGKEDPSTKTSDSVTPEDTVKPSSVSQQAAKPEPSEEEDYWFLKYEDNEGWEDPNPGQDKD
jgi:hypothetical protein